MEYAKLVIDALVAVGTLALAAIAVWGEKLRAWLAPPKLALHPHTSRGTQQLLRYEGVIMPGGGKRSRHYHLKVVNERPWLTVQNCRVLLTGLARRSADDRYQEIHFPVPFPFFWASEDPKTPVELRTVTKELVLDFGMLIEGESPWAPRLRWVPNNFDGVVRKGEAIRYQLEIEASNFCSKLPQVFEVAWDGEYPIVSEVRGNVDTHT